MRNRLSGRGRRAARRVADTMLRPVGSIGSARVPRGEIAITFDDGPDPSSTPGVLDALAHHGVHATFFVLVSHARRSPALIDRMVSEGHEIGLHGPDHTRATMLSPARLARRLTVARDELEQLAGEAVRWYRPPYGAQSLRSYVVARRLGLEVVVWSHQCEDWLPQQVDELASAAVDGLRTGHILLLHDALERDPERPTPPTEFDRGQMTDAVLRRLRAGEFHPMPVGTLLRRGRARRTAWFRP